MNNGFREYCSVKCFFFLFKTLTSFPPTAFVSITAEDTGGGIQPKTFNLKIKNCQVENSVIWTISLKYSQGHTEINNSKGHDGRHVQHMDCPKLQVSITCC